MQLDEKQIEQTYMKAQPAVVEAKKTEAGKEAAVKKVSLLDPKKTQNVELILGKLKTSNAIIQNALLICDDKVNKGPEERGANGRALAGERDRQQPGRPAREIPGRSSVSNR